ncbi:putative membrane protein [Arcticibacter svalbardensis MN12-7]|uniref:Putative membrane protein n=1 Tax=Arcticibacter svalbardensis MN12-7 TaxID=1150600 RepID=R9GV26_9SPHI|nr:FUSC family membrane protein [Arcticibacter svalbardensis]EOR95672.1 putative membrane protein [Arcticibacter svalbardensis MN12-7]
MKQTREIKNFIYSQYLADGLRITFGVLLPPLLLSQSGHLEAGIAVSMGAITTSIPDYPGAVVHKRNAMLFSILFMMIVSLLTGLINDYPLLIVAEIFSLCFFFSMFNTFGNRAASIGTGVLIIMIINIDQNFTVKSIFEYTGLLVVGGIWYMGLSLAVSQFRPYRIAQHALGDCIHQVAVYLNLKAVFYEADFHFDDTYKKLIDQQIIVHQQQDVVREILFKNRLITKSPSNTARLLILIFVDVIDLFERTMASHYDYRTIQKNYAASGILSEFHKILSNIGKELENLGFDINANERPRPTQDFQVQLEDLKSKIDLVDNNLVLKKILVNIRNIVNRINTMYDYFSDKKLENVDLNDEKDLGRFVSAQVLDPKQFIENLSLKSGIFRHALRVAIVAVIGYSVSKLLPLGHHSYWILLTILVILKPGFSLTKQRNYQRLIGTVAGGIAGALIVYYIHDTTIRFMFLMVFMILAYSFQRLNYVVSVLFMTPYVLIMFSFIGLGNLSLVQERILDTFIGSFIALIASYFLFPSWEYPQLKSFMRKLLIANYQYLTKVAEGLAGKELNITEYKLIRKELYVSSANLASAYQRMLSEPKSKQIKVREASKFIVLNHMLSSYNATLVATMRSDRPVKINNGHVKLIKRALYQLCEGISQLKDKEEDFMETDVSIQEPTIQPDVENRDSKLITEQLGFIEKSAGDILKTTKRITEDQAFSERG